MRDFAIPSAPRPTAPHDDDVGTRIVKNRSSFFLEGTVRPKASLWSSATKVDWPSIAATGVEKRSVVVSLAPGRAGAAGVVVWVVEARWARGGGEGGTHSRPEARRPPARCLSSLLSSTSCLCRLSPLSMQFSCLRVVSRWQPAAREARELKFLEEKSRGYNEWMPAMVSSERLANGCPERVVVGSAAFELDPRRAQVFCRFTPVQV